MPVVTAVFGQAIRNPSKFLRRLMKRSAGNSTSQSGKFRPRFEEFEDRKLLTTTIGLNFTGNSLQDVAATNNGNIFAPPDTQGAVGPNHIVNFTNGVWAVYNKTTGAVVGQKIADFTFWVSTVGVNHNIADDLSDPRVIYDAASQRWFACEITLPNSGNRVLLGRSDTSDPTGTWKGVAFTANVGFGDYPTLGVDTDAIYIGTNNFGSGSGVSLFSIPKADIEAASPTVANMSSFENQSANLLGFTPQGASTSDASIGHGSIVAISRTAFAVNRFNVIGSSGPGATLSAVTPIAVPTYTSVRPAFQPDGTRSIDGLDDRFSASVHRVGNLIYATHTVGKNYGGGNIRDAIDVYVIDEATNVLVASATLGDSTHDFFQPSIAANSQGDVVVTHNVSGTAAGEFVSSYASVGILNGTTLTFDAPLQLKVGLGNYHLFGGTERWGDYSATRFDPSNPKVFWAFQEIVSPANEYATQITQLTISGTGGGPTGITTVSLDGAANLVIADTSLAGKDDALTIRSDIANSRFVIADPNNTIDTLIAGASGTGTHTVFVPFSAVTGTQIFVSLLAGNDALTVDTSLGDFSKAIVADGGLDSDNIFVGGTAAADVFTANSTSISSTAANVSHTNFEAASIDGAGGGDTFNVSPSATMQFSIFGNVPPPPTLVNADSLNLNLTGVTGQTLTPLGFGTGIWSFSNRASVTFSAIERMTPGVTFTGRVFNDLNNNGNDNGGTDPGMTGVTVTLDSQADGTPDLTATSGVNGAYTFTDLAPGLYRLRQVVPGGYTQSTTNPNDFSSNAALNNTGINFGNFIPDLVAPTIVGVFLDGTSWTSDFRTAAGNATYGYPAQTGAGQLTSLPWSTVNTVYVKFSENVNVASANLGVRGISVLNYPISSFSFDSVNFVAKFTLSTTLDTDRLILDLDGDGAGAVSDFGGNKLAGGWTESVSTFPTSGAAATDFRYRFVMAVGDADRNGVVRNADTNVVRGLLFIDAGQAGYSIYSDTDGNGQIRNVDLNLVRSHLFVDPPAGPGPNRPSTGGRNERLPVGINRANTSFLAGNSIGIERGKTTARRPAVALPVAILDEVFGSDLNVI